MKREDVKKLLGENASDETVDAIMSLHGKDVETQKSQVTDLTKQLEAANGQLTEANKQIESFKGMNVEEIKKTADEYKTKFEQAQQESAAQLANLKFEHALDGALTGAKVKNVKAAKALLDMELLRKAYDDKTGTIVNFDEHLKPVKEANDYLFESDKPTPKVVTGGNNKPVLNDPIVVAARKAAGLPIEE